MLAAVICLTGNGGALDLDEVSDHCAKFLPSYMAPDLFLTVAELPRGSPGKVDYHAALELVESQRGWPRAAVGGGRSSDKQMTGGVPGVDFEHDLHALRRRKLARVPALDDRPPDGGWPTCYLLHSFGGNRCSWLCNCEGVAPFVDMNMVFVFPESGRRWFINDVSGRRRRRLFRRRPDSRYRKRNFLLGELASHGSSAGSLWAEPPQSTWPWFTRS